MIIGKVRFDNQVKRVVAGMFAAGKAPKPGVISEADLAGLPEPVQRWLRYSQVIGKERVTAVRLKQEGSIRLKAGGAWMPFSAVEYYTTDPPAFIWSARVKVAPLVWLGGTDRYEGGKGRMLFKLGWLYPVVDARGRELDQGALVRYLNETMWFPTAVLNPSIAWEVVDTLSAKATMSYQGETASAVFHFDPEGRFVTMTADRYMGLDKGFSLEPWATPITGYGEFQGVRVASQGEAVWRLKTGDFPYIQVKVTEIEYNKPEPY